MALVEEVEAQLTDHGSAWSDLDTADQAADWRQTARAVAKRLGRPIRTYGFPYAGKHHVIAELRDFPRDPAETARRTEFDRRTEELYVRTMEALGEALDRHPHPTQHLSPSA